jgi:hypothetical protein
MAVLKSVTNVVHEYSPFTPSFVSGTMSVPVVVG